MRKPRRGETDRRGQIPDMVSIHFRPPEVDKREMLEYWESDLIKGKGNASAIGTLVELSRGYLILAKMHDATATSAGEGFSATLNRMPLAAKNPDVWPRTGDGQACCYHAEHRRRYLLLCPP